MALKIKNKIVKKKANSKGTTKRKKEKNVINELNDSLNCNPFMKKEEIKPFILSIEDERKEDNEVERKGTFEKLLKKRIKQMNNKLKELNKGNTEFSQMYEDDIEKLGKRWYEKKLVNDVPRKLTIF
ncbi:hypothetical protein MKS88_004608 [Plasmodium brasilianum]|uniref:Uncharacterized protein n=2 Tax=Plasmodium (Plasmodium) TaxID=418103 RepID=A0A1D3SQC6_PLAMA|nr:conserved Plasmodium protein, unknown function [Plasmodium malariae]KAI4836803.1 hypothetical protein MKS88_004608 [Plasmodium brasilianum]SCO94102.1 conserved Plasmodium protein, unknown function [Plasmodium malariae]